MSAPELSAAASAVELAQSVVKTGVRTLAATDGGVDANQVLAYDLAHAAAAVETARALLDYGNKGDIEARITCAFVADAVAELAAKVYGREASWGADEGALDSVRSFIATYRDPAFLASFGGEE